MKIVCCDRCGVNCEHANKELQSIKVMRREHDDFKVNHTKIRQLDLCDACKEELIEWLFANKRDELDEWESSFNK